jgi:GNAT superfamily N-acetyltransferase
MEIRELDAHETRAHAAALGQLLLDAHAVNMALGLAAPLTPEAARDAYLAAADALAPGDRMLFAAFDGSEVVGAVQLDRAGGNATHRAELRRLVVRSGRRGGGVSRALVGAAVERARAAGITLLWLTTHAGTDAEQVYGRLGWTKAGTVPNWSRLPDGTLSANALFYLELE